MHNEVENAADTLDALATAFAAQGWSYELIPVNDGSTDDTHGLLEEYAFLHRSVRPQSYPRNRGRGYALRRGFAAATGRFVVSLDADLSYGTDTLVEMVRVLMDDPFTDIVLASPWMPGGNVEGVPFDRAAVSRMGNMLLRGALPARIYTSTSVCRAYRAEVLRSLDLASEGKEIHLEILREAVMLGCTIREIPATLRGRTKGRSKFRPKSTIISHLLFAVLERPAMVFAAMAGAIVFAGVPLAAYLLTVFFQGRLNPDRPLMTVMVLVLLGGAIGLGFALQSLQLLELRRSLTRLRSETMRRGRVQDVEDARGAAAFDHADLVPAAELLETERASA
jgi:glycosyltransferase involved in cell wall biosynthesis